MIFIFQIKILNYQIQTRNKYIHFLLMLFSLLVMVSLFIFISVFLFLIIKS